MINQLALSILLAVSVLGNIAQLWHGVGRYQAGRAAERAEWVEVIEDRNAQVAKLSAELSEAFDADSHARDVAVAEALGHEIPPLPPEIVAACSLPGPVRAALNRIGGAP